MRRRGRRHARRNPRIPFLGNVNFNAIGGATGGYLATRYGTGWIMSVLPPQWAADPNTAPMIRIAVKAVVGVVALPMLARALKWKGMAGPLAIGGGIAVAVDLFETYIARFIPFPMGEYEQQELSAYEMQQLEQGDDMGAAGAYGGGAYGGGAF
mgnify:CR=1 FL=1